MTPQDLVRPEILALKAYPVEKSGGMVKLDAMENPYPLPEALRRELAEVLSRVDLNRYPDPSAPQLRELIARRMGVPAGMEVLLGNGSDDLIQIVTLTVARPGAVMMYPGPTFVMYAMNATFFGLRAVPVGLREDFSLDAAAFVAAVREHRPAVVYLAYPNNPTGVLYPEEDVLEIIRACEGLVVLDEAYHAFARRTFMPRLAEFPNLVVMRTVSKIGMAGLRLGYVCGKPEWIEAFDKTRSPFNVNVVTEAVAIKLLENKRVLDEQSARVLAERERMRPELERLPGVKVFPTAANFFLVRVPDAKRVFDGLLRQGVLVRNVDSPLMKNCLRLTVGTPEENARLLEALASIPGSQHA